MQRIALSLLAAMVLCVSVVADEVAEKGRAVFEKFKPAVISVRVVVSVSAGGNSQDTEGWANGAVLDQSGLCVVALSFLDPTDLYAKMGDQNGGSTSVKIASLRLILADGTEIPAEVVLRDKELDLAYLRPTEAPKTPYANVDLEKVAEPQLLDEVVIITQLGEVARRAHSVSVDRIETIVDKPRHYFMLGEHRANAVLSAPVFSLDGQFIGLGAMRAINSAGDGGMGDNVLVVIVPAKDIKDGVTQVPAPKG